MDSLIPDLNGTTCAVAGCFEVADVVGLVELVRDTAIGFDETPVGLEVPACAEHAHQLRSGTTLAGVRFGSG